MHIPDGYLSPTTCAAMYTVAAPFWYVALKKIKTRLHTKLIPRLALFAAFSFVLMMFNIPLPGGTSGHATGVGLATVVLGPWAGMLAISTALLIQALFFGDGGITAFGANAFNMAVAGCLVTYVVYQLLSRIFKSQPISAAIGAYVGINVSALLAAIEFGIQPIFFKDAMGHPLYSPFPLSVSIPAMLIGHLTIAGLAEFLLTAGVIAYLQRTSPALIGEKTQVAPLKPAFLLLGILVVLTPLGLLSTQKAWGEWASQDLVNAPRGLQSLEKLWNAPLRDYSPHFLSNASVGYVVSAIFGVGLLMLVIFSFSALFTRRDV